MVAAGNVTGRIKNPLSDSLGRWVSQTFQGASGRRITIVSAYRVVSDVVVPGTTTAAAQQQSLLIRRNDPIQAPRKEFRRDLALYLQECKSAGDEIMLLGDFDLDVNLLFGTHIQQLSKLKPRTLYSTNVRQGSEYIRRKNTAWN